MKIHGNYLQSLGRVLVVDDHAINRNIIEGMLKKLGYESFSVADGIRAVEAVKAGEKFDLILMDIRMPIMDGYRATREIRAFEQASGIRRTNIVAVTADVYPEARTFCKESGMDDYMPKPLAIKAFSQMLSNWISAN
jgi:CheY-like chemotaxis protein